MVQATLAIQDRRFNEKPSDRRPRIGTGSNPSRLPLAGFPSKSGLSSYIVAMAAPEQGGLISNNMSHCQANDKIRANGWAILFYVLEHQITNQLGSGFQIDFPHIQNQVIEGGVVVITLAQATV